MISSASVFQIGANLQIFTLVSPTEDKILLPLAVTTPMIVELDQPHGVGVVDVRHVDIVEVHHMRVIIKTDVTGTN